jgi:hypothetical protein
MEKIHCELSGKTHVDKDLLKRRESESAKADAQFFRIKGGMLLTSS